MTGNPIRLADTQENRDEDIAWYEAMEPHLEQFREKFAA
jgi:hypothetical protein